MTDRPQPAKAGIGVLMVLVVLVTVALVGGAVMDGLSLRQDALHDRAQERFGQNYTITTSDICGEICVSTAVSTERQRRAIRIATDRRHGWVSDYEVGRSVPGFEAHLSAADTPDDVAVRSDDNGLLFPTDREYRYTGPDGRYEAGLSDAELRQWIRDRLYVTHTWYTASALANGLPATEARVAAELDRLAKTPSVQQGDSQGWHEPFGSSRTVYAHASVSSPSSVYGNSGAAPLLPVVVVVAIGVVVLFTIRRFASMLGGTHAE